LTCATSVDKLAVCANHHVNDILLVHGVTLIFAFDDAGEFFCVLEGLMGKNYWVCWVFRHEVSVYLPFSESPIVQSAEHVIRFALKPGIFALPHSLLLDGAGITQDPIFPLLVLDLSATVES
jgi:hypothetical protein